MSYPIGSIVKIKKNFKVHIGFDAHDGEGSEPIEIKLSSIINITESLKVLSYSNGMYKLRRDGGSAIINSLIVQIEFPEQGLELIPFKYRNL